jgi:hypothetical protein
MSPCPGIGAPIRVQCCCHDAGPSKCCPSAGEFRLLVLALLLRWLIQLITNRRPASNSDLQFGPPNAVALMLDHLNAVQEQIRLSRPQ